jgi:peptide/nickel transport system permease protein
MANTTEAVVLEPERNTNERLKKFMSEASKYRRLATGGIVLLVLIGTAFTADLWMPFDPTKADFDSTLQPPSGTHIMGTDRLGRDVFARVIYGSRISLFIGVGAVAFTSVMGVCMGLVSGYLGGKVDTVMMRIVDAFMAFPSLILAMVIAFALGPSLFNIALALAITRGPHFSRLVRGQVLALRERDFILAAKAIGTPDWAIMVRHLLPHITTLVAVYASLLAGSMIFAESSLAFLGLGVPPPTPTWGAMLRAGVPDLELAPWVALFPGAAVTFAVLGFNFMGDGMRDLLDPLIRNIKK